MGNNMKDQNRISSMSLGTCNLDSSTKGSLSCTATYGFFCVSFGHFSSALSAEKFGGWSSQAKPSNSIDSQKQKDSVDIAVYILMIW